MRCINIDWLEVYCFENKAIPRDMEYFKKQGYVVKKRDYGTPQYKEVLTLYEYDKPFVEIRRLPYSLKRLGGIFEDNACHIRLTNRACYQPHVIDVLRKFLIAHEYIYRSISRIDICLDFIKFFAYSVNAYVRCKFSAMKSCSSYHNLEWFNKCYTINVTVTIFLNERHSCQCLATAPVNKIKTVIKTLWERIFKSTH